MASQGVIFYNKGKKCIVRLILCINSLRRFYKGPITVVIEGEQPPRLLEDLKNTFGCDFIFDSNPNSATLIRKIEVSQKSPYDLTLFIDADMLVLGDVSEFFEKAKNHDLVASHFTDWRSDGGTIVRRIKRFEALKPHYIEAAIKYGPAINTGIYAYPKNSPIWKEWWDIATWGENKGIYIPDEVGLQVIAPQYNVAVLPSKYNTSVVYGNHIEDKRVIHFHGRKHCKEFPLCELWIKEFVAACKTNLCHIREYVGKDMGEKRLVGFLSGKYGWKQYVAEAKRAISGTPSSIPLSEPDVIVPKPLVPQNVILGRRQSRAERRERRRLRREAKKNAVAAPAIKRGDDTVTFVTAADRLYVEFLRVTLPNWIKYKQVNKHPLMVYVHGFESANDPALDFIRREHPNTQIVLWDLPGAKSQRERMLSAFVLGTARDIKTDHWVKLDADAFAVDTKSLLSDEMFDYVLCGHKWHYTKPGIWIKQLDEWANQLPIFKGTAPLFDPKNLGEKRYIHERIASYVQLHSSEFVRFAAALAGDKLPVPSHDTYLWYVARRLNLPIMRHNFKRHRGMTNVPRLEKLKRKVMEVEQQKP